SNPQKLKKVLFYSDHLIYKNQHIKYTDIDAISTKHSRKTTNSIHTEIDIYFRINYSNFESQEGSYIDLSYSSEILGWRKREITNIVINYLKDMTFTNRLQKYLIEVRANGYFTYLNGKVYNNGDIFSKDRFIANL